MKLSPLDVAWLAATIRLATPLLLAALGELIAERTGMLNIGLEGMMLAGAMGGIVGAWLGGNLFLGIVGGVAAGMALAAIGGVLCINLRADQVVVGVGLVLFGRGLTEFVFREWIRERNIDAGPMKAVEIPVLSDIPVLGRPLFDQNLLVYFTYLAVPTVAYVLYRTSWGLLLRGVGETPRALDAAGVSVAGVRWVGMMCVGGLGGLGGAFLSIGQLGSFNEGMSAGKGFIALAAVIFGGYRPLGVVAACLVFGAVDALQLRLQSSNSVPASVWLALGLCVVALAAVAVNRQRRRMDFAGVATRTGIAAVAVAAIFIVLAAASPEISLPTQLWLGMPYVAALAVLAGLGRSANAPRALAVAYDRRMH